MPPLTPNVPCPRRSENESAAGQFCRSLARRAEGGGGRPVKFTPACVSPTITVRQLSTAITNPGHGDSALVARDGARLRIVVTVPPPLSATTW